MKFTFQPESRPLAGYTLKRGIARGGFGEVYYALSDAGKEVAVKLLQHNLDIELRGVQQCLNLRHANLVTIFDVKTDADGDHWVVMEYIGGQTLEQVLQALNGPMRIEQIERWLVGLTGGLAYLHDRGIVHRDVKPGNIFWDQGAIKLGDVGLSKFMAPSRRSAHTESVGTVYYMAPEVSYGKYGYEVDVYSVGVMLFEMLSGKLPFDGQSTGEILMKHLSEPPDLNLIPVPFRPMLAAALEKDPKKRTGSMGKLLDDFRRAKTDDPQPTSPYRPAPVPVIPVSVPVIPVAQVVGSVGTPAGVHSPGIGAAKAIRVGTWAKGLGDVLDSDPVLVQAWLNTLATRCVYGLFIVLGIAFFGALPGALKLLMLFAVVATAFTAAPVALCYFYSGTVRDWFRKQINPALHSVAKTPTKPIPKADFVPPVPVPVRHVTDPPRPTPPLPLRSFQAASLSQRLTELSRSLAWATVLSFLFAAGTGFVSPLFGEANAQHADLGKLGLFTITTLMAVWSILIVSKLTAGHRFSKRYRRFLSLLTGVLVGSVAWWLSQALMVDLSTVRTEHDAIFTGLGRQPLIVNHEPTWLGFVVFFGLLFGLRRWWWHADALRPAMFRVSSVLVTVCLATILPLLFTFPLDWAVTWAAVISCVVQLSAAWIPEEQRTSRG
ncbi:MAG: serine/threonine-protein kinase [Planctomycetota bacterium]